MKLSEYQRQKEITMKHLRQAIIAGKNQDAVAITKILINRGIKLKEIIVGGVTKAMEYLDKKCTIHHFCLLELMLAGRAAMDVIDYLYAEGITKDDTLNNNDLYPKKRIILGTIKGDIHEIGKNIVSILLISNGFQKN